MRSDRSSLAKFRARIAWLGVALILTVLAVLPLPSFTEKALSHPSRTKQARLVRQQSRGRWIEIDLSAQRLTAWNGKTRVRSFMVSTGKRRTPTRRGTFTIQSKHRSTRMRGRGYSISNVPFTMYYSGSYAIHGAHWHNRFGTPVSHGCVNMRVSQARWLYNWAPRGTKVVIHR